MKREKQSPLIVSSVNPTELKELNRLIRQAFDADTSLHTLVTKGGPPGYDNGDLLARLLSDSALICRTVYRQGQLLGFFCLKEKTPTTCELRLFCVAPTQHNQGLGTAIWQKITNDFPYKSWQVETPEYSARNYYFYTEKCGFKQIGQVHYGPDVAIVLAKDCYYDSN